MNCSFEGCDGGVKGRQDLCPAHYYQRRRGGPLKPVRRRRRGTRVSRCTFPGCDRGHEAKGLCAAHYMQSRGGGKLREITRAARYPGKRQPDPKSGYVLVYRPDHPNVGSSGYLAEHRYVMSEILGRPLFPGENVHHKNGVRDDNRPDNLELWVTYQPAGQRPEDLIRWAYEIIDRYETREGTC